MLPYGLQSECARGGMSARALMSNSGICTICKVSLASFASGAHAYCMHSTTRWKSMHMQAAQNRRQVPSIVQPNSKKKLYWQQLSGQRKPVFFPSFCDIWMPSRRLMPTHIGTGSKRNLHVWGMTVYGPCAKKTDQSILSNKRGKKNFSPFRIHR